MERKYKDAAVLLQRTLVKWSVCSIPVSVRHLKQSSRENCHLFWQRQPMKYMQSKSYASHELSWQELDVPGRRAADQLSASRNCGRIESASGSVIKTVLTDLITNTDTFLTRFLSAAKIVVGILELVGFYSCWTAQEDALNFAESIGRPDARTSRRFSVSGSNMLASTASEDWCCGALLKFLQDELFQRVQRGVPCIETIAKNPRLWMFFTSGFNKQHN